MDLLLVSDSLCLGSLQLGFLHFQEVLHPQLASMLTTFWYNICKCLSVLHLIAPTNLQVGECKATAQELCTCGTLMRQVDIL